MKDRFKRGQGTRKPEEELKGGRGALKDERRGNKETSREEDKKRPELKSS